MILSRQNNTIYKPYWHHGYGYDSQILYCSANVWNLFHWNGILYSYSVRGQGTSPLWHFSCPLKGDSGGCCMATHQLVLPLTRDILDIEAHFSYSQSAQGISYKMCADIWAALYWCHQGVQGKLNTPAAHSEHSRPWWECNLPTGRLHEAQTPGTT